MESYLSVIMPTLFAIPSLKFTKPLELALSLIIATITSGFILLPFFLITIIYKNKRNLHKQEIKDKYGALY